MSAQDPTPRTPTLVTVTSYDGTDVTVSSTRTDTDRNNPRTVSHRRVSSSPSWS